MLTTNKNDILETFHMDDIYFCFYIHQKELLKKLLKNFNYASFTILDGMIPFYREQNYQEKPGRNFIHFSVEKRKKILAHFS